jgi:hypothetical protein
MTDLNDQADSSNLPMSVEDMERQLSADAERIATATGSIPIIRTKGGIFTFPDGHTEAGPLNFIVLGARLIKRLWKHPYDLADKQGLDNGLICCAIGDDTLGDTGMIPFASAPGAPEEGNCRSCPENLWGKNARGMRVKLGNCKDSVAFAVMDPGLNDKTTYLMFASATAIKDSRRVMNESKQKAGHPMKAIVEFSFVPTEQGAARLQMEYKGPNPKWPEFFSYRDTATMYLEAEPRWFDESEATTPAAAPAPVQHEPPTKKGKTSSVSS